MKISAVLAIKDEVDTYLKTLKSLVPYVDEIVVADIGMSDAMKKHVAAVAKTRIIAITQHVPYIELIRQKIINHAQYEWVLHVDPDEVVTKSLMKYLSKQMDHYDYFIIPRKNIILGAWMQHSRWWPDTQIRFFRKTHVNWSTTIHSQPTVRGHGHEVPIQEQYAIEHHNYQTYDQYISKTYRYAKAEAEGYMTRGETLTLMNALRKGVSEFVSRYFKDDGYLDGIHGFVMAFSQLLYYFQVYVYYWEMNGRPAMDRRELETLPTQFFNHALQETLHWSRVKGIVTDPISKVKEALLKRL